MDTVFNVNGFTVFDGELKPHIKIIHQTMNLPLEPRCQHDAHLIPYQIALCPNEAVLCLSSDLALINDL